MSREPIFVVGAQRSGTTMFRLMLNAHPHICIPFESGFIPSFYKRLSEYDDLSLKDNQARLIKDIADYPLMKKGKLILDVGELLSFPISNYSDLVTAIFSTYAQSKGKERWGDKTPSYVTELDIIWKLFPGCKVIHLVRDGRDVALSMGAMDWGSKNIIRLAQEWVWKTTLGHKMGNLIGDCFLEVRYEDLIMDTEITLKKVCSFLDEEYTPEMLDYHNSARDEMPSESIQYHKTSVSKPDESKVFGWKTRMSRSDRIIFEDIARKALTRFGYETENQRYTLGAKLKQIYYCAVKRW